MPTKKSPDMLAKAREAYKAHKATCPECSTALTVRDMCADEPSLYQATTEPAPRRIRLRRPLW